MIPVQLGYDAGVEQQRVVHITDATALRAMAHPLREKLLYELFARGTARATDLARALEVPVNLVSFHLRTMAKYGFIEEAPGEGKDRRERVWRPVSELGFDVADELVTDARVQANRQGAHRIVDAFFAPGDCGSRFSRDVPLRLTQEEFGQFSDELTELLMRWNRGGRQAPPDAARQTYLVNVFVQPRP